MQDIYLRPEEEATPDRPPLPPMQRQPRRRGSAFLLGAVLGLALLVAGIGSFATAFGTLSRASLTDVPLAGVFDDLVSLYRRLAGMAGSSLALVKLGNEALALAPDLMAGKRGDEFLALLERAEHELASIGSTSIIPELGAKGGDLGEAAGAFRAWLSGADERRVAIVFGNSAEMRAGGGFIGSYAEVTLKGGAVSGIVVRDITEADRASGDRTIPPVPLEPVADRWRAADANWFLSGAESGAAFLTLLNRSSLYEKHPVDAVVFVAPRVVSELLETTGPITAGQVSVDKDTFLRVIQEEVQEGQAAGAESPKAVLAELVPTFTGKILSGMQEHPLAILGAFQHGVARRDIVAYASDPGLERAFETLAVSGSLYPTGASFMGGYVAVAPSTIGGDKTDAVTDEAVRVREQLLTQGLVETSVSVERTHRGADDDPWWYKEEHRSYVKLYAPEGATPTTASGLWLRERPAAVYGSTFTTYEPLATSMATSRTYPEVPGVESFEETGKTVFGFWQRTARGSSSTAAVTYARQLARPLKAGDTYAFVLERQPASTARYQAEVFAPPGLVFAENNTSRWEWASDDPAGRTVTELHLQAAP